MDFDTRYAKLNARQKEAVDTIDGPLMVVAGPGTGKTELLSMRAANILKSTDTLPSNILCLTFTESGATAMRERLSQIIGPDAYKVAIHTFHSFGSEIINQYGEYFYHGADFRPASDVSAYELLRSIFDSLEFSNPLASQMNGEYTHLRDTLLAISELKKSGLTNDELLLVLDANEQVLDTCEAGLAEIFTERISKTTVNQLEPIAALVASLDLPILPPGVSPLSSVLALSIAHAVDAARDQDSTKPITAWKNTYLEKDEAGKFVFKDRKRIKKLRALSYVYYQYLMKMQDAQLYDFDDMVLRVVHAMEVFPDLRFNLQEKYLYIMVDEFQDTNLAQSRILHNLTTGPLGDAPNIMVVGDDDQAIYSFQGAEIGNILSFRDRFEGAKIITLTDNYRSADIILKKARSVITQGESRLERYMQEIDKTLTAHMKPKVASVTLSECARIEDERRTLALGIKEQIKKGADPAKIAVLARRHHELVALLPYFYQEDIAVNYERRDNVLDSDIIQQLLLLSRIVVFMAAGRVDEADALLPRLLAHPAWKIDSKEIWQLSLAASKNRSGWLEEMAIRPSFLPLHTWLLERSQQSLVEPAERVIDELVGTPELAASDEGFSSPFYNFFFSDERRTSSPAEYLVYLEALRTIRAKLREYRPDRTLNMTDFIEFIELHQRIGSTITSVRVRSEQSIGAVNLMTAHKSKGQEFDHVYVVGAVDSSWGERVRTRSRLIGYPENLPLQPSGDTIDERLRLFFVAMTRARKTLHISYSLLDENGKSLLPASFLTSENWQAEKQEATTELKQLVEQLQTEWYEPFLSLEPSDMRQLLAPVLESYKLSATHLNAFIDVTRGGPQQFLLSNLLRFPQSMGVQAAYGSAIHRTLQRVHSHLTTNGKRKPLEDILQDFEHNLESFHIPEKELQQYLHRGNAALDIFLKQEYDSFTASQRPELGFSNQQSRLGTAVLTGSLDLVDIDETSKQIIVTDYKTGKPSTGWSGKTDWEKVKLHKYKQQLMFYKLLVEHSRDFSQYTVEKGVLQFVEPTSGGRIVRLELAFDDEEIHHFGQLIEVVYQRITQLDLPDVSSYATDYSGVIAFENDLLGK